MNGVDLDAREVVASVRDLVDRPPDTPRPRGWLWFARAEIGTDVHRAVRAEREGTATTFVTGTYILPAGVSILRVRFVT